MVVCVAGLLDSVDRTAQTLELIEWKINCYRERLDQG